MCLLLFSSATTLRAGDLFGEIRGYVEDQQTRQRIEDAVVSVKNGKKEIVRMRVTEGGDFEIKDLPNGIYDVECSASGYVSQRIVGLEVREDRVKLAYFSLRRGDNRSEGVEMIYTYAALQAKLQTAVTTASKASESAADAPASVFVITQEEIVERGYANLSELLEDIPGVEVNRQSDPEAYNTITVRGILGNNKLLLLYNGIRVSAFSSERTSIDENFNIQHAERVEVVIGPASAIYGADAFSGVVNIIPYKGRGVQGFEVQSSLGSYWTSRSSFVAGFVAGKVDWSASGSFYRSNEPNYAKHFPNDFAWYNQQYSQSGAMGVTPFDTTLLDTIPIEPFAMPRWAYQVAVQARMQNVEIGYFHNQESHSSSIGLSPQYTLYAKDAQYGYVLHSAYLRHRLQPEGQKWTLESAATWNYYSIPRYTNFINSFSAYNRVYKFGFSSGGRIDELFTYKINESHRLSAGLLLQYSYTLPNTSDLPKRFGLVGQSAQEQDIYYIGSEQQGDTSKVYQTFYSFHRLVGGLFLQYQGNIKEKLFFTLGARFDGFVNINSYSLANDPHRIVSYFPINPRLGLVYNPVAPLRLKLFYGEAFLAPSGENAYDHYGDITATADSSGNTQLQGFFWQMPNADLRPEKVRSAEFVADYTKGNLHVSGLGFFSYAEGLIKRRLRFNEDFIGDIPILVAQYNTNENRLISYGAIAQFDYHLQMGKEQQTQLKFRLNYAYVQGTFLKDSSGVQSEPTYLPFSAQHTVKAGILFKHRDFSWHVNGLLRTVSYNERVDATGNPLQSNMPDGQNFFVVLNTRLRYTFHFKDWHLGLFADVKNATNARYYHASNNTIINLAAFPQSPILVMGGLSIGFGNRR